MGRISISLFILMTLGVSSFSQFNDKIIRMGAVEDFPVLTREGIASNRLPYAPFHVEEDLNALAGDDLNFTFHMAAAEGVFPGKTGIYTVCLNTLTERDGECVYNVYVNDERVGLFQQNPPTNEFIAPATLQWTGVEIPENAKIRVESTNGSNLQRHEGNFFEYARGRWTGVIFIPEEGIENPSNKNQKIGIFEKIEGVGSERIPFQARYDQVEEAYYLSVAGENTGSNDKSSGYLWKTVEGDFTLETLLTPIGFNNNRDRQAGLIIRPSSEPEAPYVGCAVQGNGSVYLKYRKDSGSETEKILFAVTEAEMIQLEKKGNTFTISAAKFGEDYERRSVELSGFSGVLKVGFYVASNSSGLREIARFSRLRFFEDLTGKVKD